MKKIKQNYGLFLNVLLFGGLIIFLSGCGRERSAMSSVQYEKLRKQSIEIESGTTLASKAGLSKESEENDVTTSNTDINLSGNKPVVLISEKQTIAANVDSKVKNKVPMVQKILAKKIAKKMGEGQQTAQLDQNLKYALIFGAAGLVLSIFGYPFYFIGAVLMIVGLVFLILWLLEQ